MNIDTMRLQLIEVASTRPRDLSNWYNKHLRYEDGCSYLDTKEPIALFYRGKVRYYDSLMVPFALAGVDPKSPRSCNHPDCVNPDHV